MVTYTAVRQEKYREDTADSDVTLTGSTVNPVEAPNSAVKKVSVSPAELESLTARVTVPPSHLASPPQPHPDVPIPSVERSDRGQRSTPIANVAVPNSQTPYKGNAVYVPPEQHTSSQVSNVYIKPEPVDRPSPFAFTPEPTPSQGTRYDSSPPPVWSPVSSGSTPRSEGSSVPPVSPEPGDIWPAALTGSPTCRKCCSSQANRRITGMNNYNGNGGRPYYTCIDCSNWLVWDDDNGILASNALCMCGKLSRQNRTSAAKGGYLFYNCARGRCGYWRR